MNIHKINATSPINVNERSELAIETFHALQLTPDTGRIRENMAVLNEGLQADSQASILPTLEPFQPIDIHAGFPIMALYNAYRRISRQKTTKVDQTWQLHTITELNRRSLVNSNRPGATMARAMLLGGDRLDSPGLYSVSLNYDDQRIKAQENMDDYNATHANTNLGIVSPADYVMLNAQRLVEGIDKGEKRRKIKLLDGIVHFVGSVHTSTRFPQIDVKAHPVDGKTVGAGAENSQGLCFFAQYPVASHSVGVRMSIGANS